MSADKSLKKPSSGLTTGKHWRDGETAWLCRHIPLPEVCILSGEPAGGTVGCMFHWNREIPQGGGPPEAVIIQLIRHYFLKVPKAFMRVPMASRLLVKRKFAWVFIWLTIAVTVATVCGLIFGQAAIERMQAGPQKKFMNDWGIPIVAMGGFLCLALFAFLANKLLPAPTVVLKVMEINDTHVLVTGAHPEFLENLEEIAAHEQKDTD